MNLALVAVGLFVSSTAFAQIQNQPVEIVRAAPLSSFTERSGTWPSEEIPEDRLSNDRADLSERLNQIPGVEARTSGSPVVSIRGSGQADRTLRLFEGLPLNMADGVGASEFFLPTEALGSLSLIKGPASVFYGGSAMAGAIDHRLRFFERNALRLTAADDGGWLGPRSLFGAILLPGIDRGQLTLFHERTPGRFPFQSTSTTQSGRRESNAVDLSRATLAGDLKLGNWNFKLRGLGAKAVGESPGSLTSPFRSTFDTTASLASVEARRDFDNAEFFSLRLSDSRIWGLYDRDTTFTTTSSTARSAVSLDSRKVFSFGGLRTFGDFISQSLSASYFGDAHYYQFDSDLGQSFEVPLTASLMVQPAYRYRSTDGAWSKALALIDDHGRDRTYVTYAEGYRSASLSDRFGNYGTFRGNASLQPERSWSVEAGFNEENGQRYGAYLNGWALSGSLYFTRYDNLVDTQTSGGLSTKINTGRARTFGVEANAATTISVWMLSLGYNYMDARNEQLDEPLRLSPQHQASAAAAQQLGPIVAELRETYWSDFFDRDPLTNALVQLPSWSSTDLEFRSIALTDWEFKAGVLNIFDRPRELTIGYPEPQRRFFASALRYF